MYGRESFEKFHSGSLWTAVLILSHKVQRLDKPRCEAQLLEVSATCADKSSRKVRNVLTMATTCPVGSSSWPERL